MKEDWSWELMFAIIGIILIVFALRLSDENISIAWICLISGILVLMITAIKNPYCRYKKLNH